MDGAEVELVSSFWFLVSSFWLFGIDNRYEIKFFEAKASIKNKLLA